MVTARRITNVFISFGYVKGIDPTTYAKSKEYLWDKI